MTTLAGRVRTARPGWRTPVFLLGIALAAGAVLSPLDRLDRPLPFGDSRAVDQLRAASAMIGFEMLLFSLAFVLAFVFAIVSEGHERSRAEAGRPR